MSVSLWHSTRRKGDGLSIQKNGFLAKDYLSYDTTPGAKQVTGAVVGFFKDKPPVNAAQPERLRVTFPEMTESDLLQYDTSLPDYQQYQIPTDIVNASAKIEIDEVWDGERRRVARARRASWQ